MALLKEKNILLVIIFAIVMAYLESTVVVYLRAMYGIEVLLRDINLTIDKYTFIEIGREVATVVMLAMISIIAGNNNIKKFGYFFLSFGIWDIFYYFWLYVFIQWPKSLFEWDVLFLIPLPWWSPVIAPLLISILLIFIGYSLINEVSFKINSKDWIIISVCIIIILYTFVEDSIGIILSGKGDILNVKPTTFNWFLFGLGYLGWCLMSFKIFFFGFKK